VVIDNIGLMGKFKRIFYIICLMFFLVLLFLMFFQEDIMFNTDSALYLGRIGLAKFLIKMGGIGIALFILALIVENIHIASLKSKVSTSENEKLELKAKLYDNVESKETDLNEEESSKATIEKKEPETK